MSKWQRLETTIDASEPANKSLMKLGVCFVPNPKVTSVPQRRLVFAGG